MKYSPKETWERNKMSTIIPKRKRQTAEGIRKWPAGLQMNITPYVLAANLGPIM